MSAVLAAVFDSHKTAEAVRTRLVKEGFPTDRVALTSREELGQAKVVPAAALAEKLTQYFQQLFPGGSAQDPVRRLQAAVVAGHAVLAVHPRGEVETAHAAEILDQGNPLEIRAKDLGDQTLEHAAADEESSALSWIGRVMVAPLAPDR